MTLFATSADSGSRDASAGPPGQSQSRPPSRPPGLCLAARPLLPGQNGRQRWSCLPLGVLALMNSLLGIALVIAGVALHRERPADGDAVRRANDPARATA